MTRAVLFLGDHCPSILGIDSGVKAGPTVMGAIALELIFAWAIFVGDPIIGFWLASRSLPPRRSGSETF
ncbi:MAG: hypothetical protein M3082_14290 [Candidatus Dormibacteraeota bacterium]|nr:hypothetical protein [Candidatus Dormibacteraeota bacterium]